LKKNLNDFMKNTKWLVLTALAVASTFLTGCVASAVPKLTMTIDPVTHSVALSNPKDTTIHNFHAEVNPDGSSLVTFDTLTTVMNPDVITTTGDAQAKLIAATAAAVQQAIESAAAAAAK
jgi:hypothetical protein